MFEAIFEAVWGIASQIYLMMQSFVKWFWDWALSWVFVLLDEMGVDTETWQVPEFAAGVMYHVDQANYWLPLQEAWTAATTYYTLWLVALPIKWMLKSIPAIW